MHAVHQHYFNFRVHHNTFFAYTLTISQLDLYALGGNGWKRKRERERERRGEKTGRI